MQTYFSAGKYKKASPKAVLNKTIQEALIEQTACVISKTTKYNLIPLVLKILVQVRKYLDICLNI